MDDKKYENNPQGLYQYPQAITPATQPKRTEMDVLVAIESELKRIGNFLNSIYTKQNIEDSQAARDAGRAALDAKRKARWQVVQDAYEEGRNDPDFAPPAPEADDPPQEGFFNWLDKVFSRKQ